jgi:HSP20 family protein
MSARDNPFARFEELFDRMRRQFDEAAETWDREGLTGLRSGSAMAIDVVDRPEELVVVADMPGFERDDIQVRVTDDALSIEGDHESEYESDEANYLVQERTHRSVRRSIPLPDAIEEDDITARFSNGTLEITLPKVEPTEAGRSVEISVA